MRTKILTTILRQEREENLKVLEQELKYREWKLVILANRLGVLLKKDEKEEKK